MTYLIVNPDQQAKIDIVNSQSINRLLLIEYEGKILVEQSIVESEGFEHFLFLLKICEKIEITKLEPAPITSDVEILEKKALLSSVEIEQLKRDLQALREEVAGLIKIKKRKQNLLDKIKEFESEKIELVKQLEKLKKEKEALFLDLQIKVDGTHN